ncbi:MAG: sugar ABC transporter substrate-binding protein, partial [Anaerolineae bacterium]|nr:sugar ABC transporter substrate-binding protein [Anaerolineae bacterium]
TKQILDEWVPIGQTTGTHLNSIFPALNEIEGEGVMQTLTQDILLGKDATESLQRAADRIKAIVEG